MSEKNIFDMLPEISDLDDKRLWLAGMAMQALVGLNLSDVHTIARQAYAMADAMLEAECD